MKKRILKTLGLFLFLGTLSMASVSHINYKASFGIFGTVGTIKNTVTKNAKTYTIETKVRLSGMAHTLLGGQKEHYISKGHLYKGRMVSDFYEMTSTKKKTKKVKTYTINHKTKTVSKRYRKWVKGKLTKDKTKKLKYYGSDDLLTLYFNMGTVLKKKGKVYTFSVVGLEKQKGQVKVTVPLDSKAGMYKKDLGKGAVLYAKALIHQKNFKKDKGNILLSVGKDDFVGKAVIKNIMLYGDAVLTRTK